MGRRLMTIAVPKEKGLPLKVVKHPKVEKLTILLLHEKKPDKDGFWRFAPEFPRGRGGDAEWLR